MHGKLRLWFDANAYIFAPGAAVIGTVLGLVLTWVPAVSLREKILWAIAFSLLGVLAIVGTVWDRRVSVTQQARRDSMGLRSIQDVMREVRLLAKRDLPRLHSARQRAAFFATQIHLFLAQHPPPEIPPNVTAETLHSPEVLAYAADSQAYESAIRAMYRDQFQVEAFNIAIELARAGEPDELLLALVYNIHLSGMLKVLADRFQSLANTTP